jgi:hypothetical protein
MTALSSMVRTGRVKRAGPAVRYNAGMHILQRSTAPLLAAAVLAVLPALVSAHEVTHTGTVVALNTAKYAQPGGGTREVRELEVAVVDPKTKKVTNRVFTITDKTKITRPASPSRWPP